MNDRGPHSEQKKRRFFLSISAGVADATLRPARLINFAAAPDPLSDNATSVGISEIGLTHELILQR